MVHKLQAHCCSKSTPIRLCQNTYVSQWSVLGPLMIYKNCFATHFISRWEEGIVQFFQSPTAGGQLFFQHSWPCHKAGGRQRDMFWSCQSWVKQDSMADEDETMAFLWGAEQACPGRCDLSGNLPTSPGTVPFSCAGGQGNQWFWKSPVGTNLTCLKFSEIPAVAWKHYLGQSRSIPLLP